MSLSPVHGLGRSQPKDVPEDLRLLKYTPRAMGDRYARYWKAVYDMAVKRNPNVKVGVYLYHNTLPGPVTDIKLNKNIFGEFVIYGARDGWYPMSREEDQWYRDQWLAWEKTGMIARFRAELFIEQLCNAQRYDPADGRVLPIRLSAWPDRHQFPQLYVQLGCAWSDGLHAPSAAVESRPGN